MGTGQEKGQIRDSSPKFLECAIMWTKVALRKIGKTGKGVGEI